MRTFDSLRRGPAAPRCDDHPMNDGLDRASATLTNGEQVLWSGAPDPDVLFSPGDAFLIPFSVLWASFAVFWEFTAWVHTKAPSFFLVFGGAFVAIGLYMVFFRFAVGRYRRRTTTYVLTSRRAIVVGARSLKSVRVDPDTLSTSWTRDRQRISVNFGFPQLPVMRQTFSRWSMSTAAMMGPFTGWDPINLNPTPVYFQDVVDPAGLEAAIARVAG